MDFNRTMLPSVRTVAGAKWFNIYSDYDAHNQLTTRLFTPQRRQTKLT